MRIAVCLKYGIDVNLTEAVDAATGTINDTILLQRLDSASIAALASALRFKQEYQAELIAVMIGPEEADFFLKEVYALGASEVYRIWDDGLEQTDTRGKALLLSSLLDELSPSIVFCGSRSSDTSNGQLPAFIAEMLDFTQLTYLAEDVILKDNKVIGFRRLAQGAREKIEAALPVVLSIDWEEEGMIYGSLDGYLAALDKEIHVRNMYDLGLTYEDISSWNHLNKIISISQPSPAPKSIFIPTAEDPIDRIREIVSGGLEQKTGEVIEGSPEQLAERAFQFLLEHKFI